MTGKTERFIVQAQPRGELPYHDSAREREELGPSYHCMSNSLVPEADIYIDVNHVKQVPVDLKPFLEPHRHSVSKVYTVIGDLTVEVTLDGERHEVSGPAGIFVPAGILHTIRPLKGSGYMVLSMRAGKYEASR